MSDMKRFNALKKVTAKPMTRGEYNDLRGWNVSTSAKDEEGYLIVDPEIEANTSSYHGEVSWVPKENFEKYYYEPDDQQVDTQGGDAYREIMFNGWLASQQAQQQSCTAPADDHELTDDEVKRKREEAGLLCDGNDTYDLTGNERFDFGMALHLMEVGERVQREGWNGKGMFVYIVPAASYPAQRNAKGVLVGDYPDDMVPYSAYIALKTNSGEVVPWTISQSDALATDWCLA